MKDVNGTPPLGGVAFMTGPIEGAAAGAPESRRDDCGGVPEFRLDRELLPERGVAALGEVLEPSPTALVVPKLPELTPRKNGAIVGRAAAGNCVAIPGRSAPHGLQQARPSGIFLCGV